MIDWIIDRVWAWKNRDELAALDAQIEYLFAESRRLDGEMEKAFGPDWREQSERRLREVMFGRYTVS
jgi:hypothetical protein